MALQPAGPDKDRGWRGGNQQSRFLSRSSPTTSLSDQSLFTAHVTLKRKKVLPTQPSCTYNEDYNALYVHLPSPKRFRLQIRKLKID